MKLPGAQPQLVRQEVFGGKLSPATGKGAVVLFSPQAGTYRYITQRVPDGSVWHTDGTAVSRDEAGRAVIEARFEGASAHIVLFGTD